MRRLALLLLSAVAFAGPNESADAADKKVVTKAKPVVVKKAPSRAPSGTTGFYVGVNGGGAWGNTSLTNIAGVSSGMKTEGGLAGFTIGYNGQSGAVVYGLETDIAGTWIKGTSSDLAPCFGCEVNLNYFGTVRGRLGYAVGHALPYFTGGFAYAGIKTSLAGGVNSQTVGKSGWTVGGGVEYALGGPWSVKTEYLYFELGRTTCEFASCGAAIDYVVRGNIARLGFNYRF